MRQDITYKGIVGRYEYLFTDCWSVVLKAGAESVTSGKVLQGNLRYNYIYSLAALYAPIPTQKLHFLCSLCREYNSLSFWNFYRKKTISQCFVGGLLQSAAIEK